MNPNRKNLANGILALGVSTSDTTWVLESGYGGSMPAVPFFLTTTPFGQLSTMGNSEIVNVTARTGDTLTVVRAQKGTTARAFAAGSVVSNGVYVEDKVGSSNIDLATLLLGYASRSTSQTVNQNGTIVDVGGLSLTVTVDGTQTIRIFGNLYFQTSTSGVAQARLRDGENTIQIATQQFTSGPANAMYIGVELIIKPTAGQHTYKLSGSLPGTTNNFYGSSEFNNQLLIQLIG